MADLKKTMERGGIFVSDITRDLKLGKSTVYAILNDSYTGKPEVAEMVKNYIEERCSGNAKKEEFSTVDQDIFRKGLEFAYYDHEFSAITGPSGIGKTYVCESFVKDHDKVIHYKIIEGIAWKSTLSELSRRLSRNEHGTCSDMMQNIMEAISSLGVKLLIIDEVEHLFKSNHRAKFLERIAFFREIHERCGIGVVIVGLDVLESELRFASKTYITNRIDCLLRGEPAEPEDLQRFWEIVLGMPVDRVAEAIFEKARERGNYRILKKLVEKAKAMGGRVDAALKFVFI